MIEEHDKKLETSLHKYKLSLKRLKQQRPTTILLEAKTIHEIEMNVPSYKQKQTQLTSCASHKKNGLPCPSVRKKGSLYCHRHSKMI
jgi:hypothetical protein|tara:strand:- start:598 stop:858 length:261 start_codon:yes stop_codon:yes gene_type:complete